MGQPATQAMSEQETLVQADAVESFRVKVEPLGVDVEQVAGSEGAARYLIDQSAQAETGRIVITGELAERAPDLVAQLAGAGIEIAVSQSLEDPRDAPLGVTLARNGVVETGSALMAERSLPDRAVSLLTMTCVILIETGSLLPTLNEAGQILREIALQPGSGFATLVTGPSRTADIEMSLTVGVQGPRVVRILFVDDLR